MCRNGLFKERGINQLDGYGSQRWRVESDYCVKLDPALRSVGMLMEPTTVVAKAVEQIQRIGGVMGFEPRRVLVTGAGPIGLLGAMLAVQRGLEVHVLDRVSDGPKPQLVEDLGATYHSGDIADAMGKTGAEAILEATGVGKLVFDAMDHLSPGGIVCLTGLSPAGGTLSVEAGSINRDLVLQNNVVLGSVNANRRHYQAAAKALAAADRAWLERLITRRVPLESYEEALEARPDDVKVVIEIGAAAAS
jgi:threonine dehydrogenase-like Zn-dependent dehydrogenase